MVLIAIVGMAGSGKSEATSFFLKNGYSRVYFGQVTMDILEEKGLEKNEANEREVRESLRKEFGMAAYAIHSLPKIHALSEKTDKIILDGLYSWEEYLTLKKEFPEMMVLSIYASPKKRHERLKSRPKRSLSDDQAISRDHSEIKNLHKAGPIAMADYTIINEGTLEDLEQSLTQFMSTIPH